MSSEKQALEALIEQSEDLHSDAMRSTRAGLADMVEHGQERRAGSGFAPDELAEYQGRRRTLLTGALKGAGLLAGTVGGLGLLESLTSAAGAQSAAPDVQAAQTAASLENLAVAVYTKAAGLPFMKSIPNPAGTTVVAFVTKTIAQHTEHAKAFNGAAIRLGGNAQTGVDKAVFDTVVTPTLPKLKTPLDVVNFAADLENVAAQTYVAETAAVDDSNLRNTFASIMGVESQHRAILLAVAALLQNNLANLVMLGPPADKLPSAAGSVGFPDAFIKTTAARPAGEGAVA